MDLATLGLRIDANGFVRDARRASNATRELRTEGAAAERTMQQLRRALAALGLALGVREVINYADSWRLVESRLRLVLGTTELVGRVQERLFDMAQRTRTSFEATAELYTRVARNAEQLGRSQNEVLAFTETVQKAIQLGGTGAQEAEAGVRQLSQALASGQLRGDEFRSVMENMNGVARILAQGLGVSVGELRGLAAEGQLTADKVVDAVLRMKESVDRDFETVPVTIGQAFQVVSNALQRYIGETDEANGASARIAAGIVAIARNLDTLVPLVISLGVAWGTYNIMIKAAVAWNAIMAASSTIAAFISLAKSVRSVADAMALLSLVGKGALGAVAAIAAVAAGWFAYKKLTEEIARNTEEQNAALDKLLETVTKTTGGVSGLTDAQKKELDQLKEWREQNEDLYRTAKQNLELAQLDGIERDRVAVAINAENRAIEAQRRIMGDLTGLTADQIAARRALLAETLKMISAVNALELAEVEAAEETRRRNEEQRAQKAIFEETARGIQRALAQAFRDLQEDGLRSFRGFLETLGGMFRDAFAEIAALLTAKALGLDDLLADIRKKTADEIKEAIKTGQGIGTNGFQRYGLGAIIGAGVGLETGSPGAGFFTGAAAGFAFGGNPLAVGVGALAGFIGGLIGSAEAMRKEREARERLREQLDNELAVIRSELFGGSGVERTIADVRARFDKLRQLTDEAFEDIPVSLGGRRIPGLTERGRMAELDRLEQEAIEKARRDFAEQQRQVQEEARIRMLRAQGLNEAADAAALALDHERRLAEARKAGYDAATIAAIELANAAEKAAQNAERARQHQQALEDLEVRRLRALGLDAQADRLAQQHLHQRQLDEARRAGMSPEFIARLLEVQRIERERFGLDPAARNETIRSVRGISETSALTLIHIGRTQVSLLSRIEANTRRGSDGVWATGAAGRGGMVVQITQTFHGPVNTTPDWSRQQGREIGRGIDEALGLEGERTIQFDGDPSV